MAEDDEARCRGTVTGTSSPGRMPSRCYRAALHLSLIEIGDQAVGSYGTAHADGPVDEALDGSLRGPRHEVVGQPVDVLA
jgi:hypothetical protein